MSLRGYGNRRFGVTAIVASGLRQMPLRGYDKTRCGLPVNTAVCRRKFNIELQSQVLV
ncbi:hypothetical protein [Prevotella nigrescens]